MTEWSASRIFRLRGEAAGARLALDSALAQLAHDERTTPCADNPAFTSEDRAIRSAAAEACGLCPVRRQCGAFAQANREPHGIWGGTDRSEVAP